MALAKIGRHWAEAQPTTERSSFPERDRNVPSRLVRGGIFRDVEELIVATGDYVDKHNDNPKPFVGTATAFDVLEKVKRVRAVLDNR
jgi:predicted MPP superfamily phosphohydrolase